MKGVILRILPNRGYGFIRGEDGPSRFFHATTVEPIEMFDFMHEGQQVEFEPTEGGHGGNKKRATHVRVVEGS